jgi:hypothetical protein
MGLGVWKTEAFVANYRDLIDFRPGAVPNWSIFPPCVRAGWRFFS